MSDITNGNDDDDFDMFAPSEAAVVPNPMIQPKEKGPPSKNASATGGVLRADNLNDAEGYFRAPAGTVLSSSMRKYEVLGELGSGVFSTVYLVNTSGREGKLALKVLRANETMYKAGLKEIEILKKIKGHPHLVSLEDDFELISASSPHLVLVFELLAFNLRETLNKFGQGVGISLDAVRQFGRQLLSALAILKKYEIVHADFKPDNILVSQDFKRCVLADFGSAFYLSEPKLPTPYLVSRYYRAPEIVLGLDTYGCEVDVWSLGVTLFELFTGSILFNGKTNNEMLDLFQTRIGKFPKAIIKRHIAQYEKRLELEAHFEGEEFRFKRHEVDPITGKIVRKLIKFTQDKASGPQSLKGIIIKKAMEEGEDDVSAGLTENVLDFAEALERLLELDPVHRIDPSHALASLRFFGGSSTLSRQHQKRMKTEQE